VVAMCLIFVILIPDGPVEQLVNKVFIRDKGTTAGDSR